jgi:hypothetical protein
MIPTDPHPPTCHHGATTNKTPRLHARTHLRSAPREQGRISTSPQRTKGCPPSPSRNPRGWAPAARPSCVGGDCDGFWVSFCFWFFLGGGCVHVFVCLCVCVHGWSGNPPQNKTIKNKQTVNVIVVIAAARKKQTNKHQRALHTAHCTLQTANCIIHVPPGAPLAFGARESLHHLAPWVGRGPAFCVFGVGGLMICRGDECACVCLYASVRSSYVCIHACVWVDHL